MRVRGVITAARARLNNANQESAGRCYLIKQMACFLKKAGNIHAAVDTGRGEEPRNFCDPAARNSAPHQTNLLSISLYGGGARNFTLPKSLARKN